MGVYHYSKTFRFMLCLNNGKKKKKKTLIEEKQDHLSWIRVAGLLEQNPHSVTS